MSYSSYIWKLNGKAYSCSGDPEIEEAEFIGVCSYGMAVHKKLRERKEFNKDQHHYTKDGVSRLMLVNRGFMDILLVRIPDNNVCIPGIDIGGEFEVNESERIDNSTNWNRITYCKEYNRAVFFVSYTRFIQMYLEHIGNPDIKKEQTFNIRSDVRVSLIWEKDASLLSREDIALNEDLVERLS
jgi:hypothetical protein